MRRARGPSSLPPPAAPSGSSSTRYRATTARASGNLAALLTKEWAGQPDPAALTKLGRYRFVAQVTHRGELSKPFALGGIRVEDVLDAPATAGKAPAGEAAARMQVDEVIAHLETLDAARPAPLWAPTEEGT